MKKLLALVLALVMTMSLVTISNAAFDDADDIDYSEAVEVMNAIGVLEGSDGKFSPKAELTRAQACKIICVMLLGKTAADALNLESSFVDVSGWAESYIAYCASQGIVAGVGDNKFDPEGKLTGYQFGKMLLVALGYKADLEGMTGSDWQVAVAKLAFNAGLNDGLDISLTKVLTREEAAQMAFNALTARMVAYTNGTKVETTDGTKVTVNSTRYDETNYSEDGYKLPASSNDGYLQFCEQYFPKLKSQSAASGDSFGRPATQWIYKGVTVGTYGKTADKVYTAAASGDTTSAKISNMGIKGYELAGGAITPVVNGKDGTDVDALSGIVALTGNGTVVELFFDEDNAETITDIIVIKTQLMQVNRVNKAAETVTLKKVNGAGESIVAVDDENDCYDKLSGMKKDDYVLVTYAWDSTDNNYEVYSVAEPATVTGKLSSVSTNKSGNVNGVTVAGEKYSLAATKGNCFSGLNNTSIKANKDCTLYVDSYGYAVYVEDVAASVQYILVADTYSTLVDGKIVTMVSGYDMDGVKVTLNVGTARVTADVGEVWSYDTTDENSADYELDAEASSETLNSDLKKSDNKFQDTFFADDVNYIFVNMNENGDEIDSISVKSGKQAVASGTEVYYILNDDNDRIVTMVVIGEADVAEGSAVAYVNQVAGYAGQVDGKNTMYYNLYIDGVLVKNVQSKNTSLTVGDFVTYEQDGALYTLKAYTTSSGKATSVDEWTIEASDITDGKYVEYNGVDYVMDAEGQVIDTTDAKDYGDLGDMGDAAGKTFTCKVVFNDNSDSVNYQTISYIFITAVSD